MPKEKCSTCGKNLVAITASMSGHVCDGGDKHKDVISLDPTQTPNKESFPLITITHGTGSAGE